MENKKPDSVVWNDEKGYNQSQLTYGTNNSAPAIKLDDVGGWKQSQVLVVNQQFKTKFDELKEEFKKLIDEVNWNELVYSSTYNFLPVIGQVYHLYIREDESTFLSLIDPNTWNKKYVGSFKLDSTQKWVKV